ncbi:hypothetical protein RJT34_20016 [Clitoria ternatea]|uniref:Uncharacterized protein n=1 Tax=Clitoria ternatea TaxID=43366 RepID=A0AAN9IS37_CLITE
MVGDGGSELGRENERLWWTWLWREVAKKEGIGGWKLRSRGDKGWPQPSEFGGVVVGAGSGSLVRWPGVVDGGKQ